jgi:predicted GNAT family N-acyltransferase
MSQYDNLVICPLHATHNRPDFTCGNEPLDHYLKKQANPDIKRRISRVFVATTHESPTKIVGYYTLSALSIALNQLPEETKRKLPRHPIPAALIGRLAVSQSAQGYGVGKLLLTNAISRTLAVSNEVAIYAMVVDAIDESAEKFYLQYGFAPLATQSRRLFLKLNSI